MRKMYRRFLFLALSIMMMSTHTVPLYAADTPHFTSPSSMSRPPLKPSSWLLRSDTSAQKWDQAYPVGSGTLGALSQGLFPKSIIYLSHDAVWKSGNRLPVAPDSRKAGMDRAFELCLNGDYNEAQRAYAEAKNKGGRISTFQGLAELHIEHLNVPESMTIDRRLDLYTGIVVSRANLPRAEISETLLASYPDNCLLVRLKDTRSQGLHCRLRLTRGENITKRYADPKGMGVVGFSGEHGSQSAKGMQFAAHIGLLPEAGTRVLADGNDLLIQGGAAITLIVTAGTDYNRRQPRQPRRDAWEKDVLDSSERAAAMGWQQLRVRAVADHCELMGRFDVDLGDTAPDIVAQTTPERVRRLQEGGTDPDLVESFVHLGRHMLVSSSRPGGLPPNLQGVWAVGLKSAWNGDYHLNVNVQMNLWLANPTGLSECHEPFFAMLESMHHYGKETAASLGCEGYAACLASDPWGYTEFHNGAVEYDSTVLGAHWCQQHLMETYRFTGDRDFLQETAWPILQDGARFMLDWLRENPETNRLITGPGGSPENVFVYTDAEGTKRKSYVSIGNTYGLVLAKECLIDAMECARILNIDNDLTRQISSTLPRVQDVPINRDGRIGEWWKPFEEPWKGHRHKSHLYGLFPGNQICVEGTPDYAKAALASLKVRMSDENKPGDVNGGGHTGWNLAWATALWSRVYQGEEVRASILEQMRTQINENLFNRCNTPFQVDGNFGVVAGVAEMLLQSHERRNGRYTLRLLPALAQAWSTGQARGLYARGGFIVENLTWENGQVMHCTVRSTRGGDLSIVANGKTQQVKTKAGQTVAVILP